VLLAQVGSFVPATSARLGVVDRVFARVGAQDDLAGQRSTFMVEMIETANILRNATPRSLLVLDEIGRGTSTFDGIAVARAVVEHLHDNPRLRCKTLFATHYHELADLAHEIQGVTSLQVEVLERGDRVVFLHRVVTGAADRSYGVHVARLAGVPEPVARRAAAILADLERARDAQAGGDHAGTLTAVPDASPRLPAGTAEALRRLTTLEPMRLSPLDALAELVELVRLVGGEPGHSPAEPAG
jgi:DNA mismatch repair protein MutS